MGRRLRRGGRGIGWTEPRPAEAGAAVLPTTLLAAGYGKSVEGRATEGADGRLHAEWRAARPLSHAERRVPVFGETGLQAILVRVG